MRLINYFDRGADLYPARHCLHDGTRSDVVFLFYHSSVEGHLPRIRGACPKIRTFICLEGRKI